MNLNRAVTVIIPCFNHGRFLAECVESLRRQRYQDWCAIIVNDGSTDGVTPGLADALADGERIRVLHLATNRGRSLARNAAIECARTEAIFPLDADDLLLPEHFELTLPLLYTADNVGIVYTDYRRFGGQNGVMKGERFDLRRMYLRRYVWAGSLFRKSAWQRVGGYKDAFRDGNEDYDLWLSIVEAGYVGRYVPKALVRYRSHADSWTQSGVGGGDRVYLSRLRLLEHHRSAIEAQGAVKSFLVRTYREEARRLARSGQLKEARAMLTKALAEAPYDPGARLQAWWLQATQLRG